MTEDVDSLPAAVDLIVCCGEILAPVAAFFSHVGKIPLDGLRAPRGAGSGRLAIRLTFAVF